MKSRSAHKSKTKDDILAGMTETFRILRWANIKLNPGKCSFGVEEGSSWGVTVTKEGFRACLDKVAAVTNVKSPSTLKEV